MLNLPHTAFCPELLETDWCLSDKEGNGLSIIIRKCSAAAVGLGETVFFSDNMLSKLLKFHCKVNVCLLKFQPG